MPIINITMTHEDGGATKEQKEQLAYKMTSVFDEVFGRGGKSAVVVINEVSTDNYAIGGKTITDIRKEQKTS
ncbi:tautomerase family protein [Candidatus Marinarcus aquaticus]|uniref:Tautomerase n=1 Tax=Candidatus Marinarcus aquaticus TaxID=2044504 RepID=A0A4Q0XV61_9BACT|nr:4-oxalocrotonate tautomerase family protein [Candidatus Marinarcus aquaticus]RXJ60875.1 tautomerase [Candidatus Marinarcus aquaticus]